jgi:sensor histidine kinase YesM
MEVLMLFSITFLLALISDVEYSIYEEGSGWLFINSLEYRIIFGAFSFLLYGSYYWLVAKPLVSKRKPLLLALSLIAFIPFTFYYDHYIANWTVIRLPFISAELRDLATRQYKAGSRFNIIYAYRLSSRCLPLIFFAYLIRSLKQDAQLSALKEQQMVAELNYLRTQLQPHFFFNTLNNIYALAIRQSGDTAPMVMKLSDMMRYILYQTGESKVLLSKEVAFLHDYVELERIRHPQHIHIALDVQGDTGSLMIEPLLLLPFVENAFKHGAREMLDEGEVMLVLCMQEGELLLQTRNAKPAATAEARTTGIGLLNVQKRLDLLYPGRHTLLISESAGYYEVNLSIQLA